MTNIIVVWHGWNQDRTLTCYLTYHTIARDFVGHISYCDGEVPPKTISETNYADLKTKLVKHSLEIPSKFEMFTTILRGEPL